MADGTQGHVEDERGLVRLLVRGGRGLEVQLVVGDVEATGEGPLEWVQVGHVVVWERGNGGTGV